MAINRRAFVTATAAGIASPTFARATECPAAGMDWMNMSLEARNLAYNNGAHVGLDGEGVALLEIGVGMHPA
jgi:hypothetical protein